ncbi:AraC family transcriptional regulator [uncultured Prevotella sp.]|uniref:helix-turn-helix domain-containing protein n=1 Tax=uncultured Prevotella sp. TaxID=159272 RepID=UPI0025876D81|nr:AraC family transcriptional regulator [uncultured Prevotella sp.]
MTGDWKYLFITYGMAIMFYSMMAWLFWFRSRGRAKHMIAFIMLMIALQNVKDLAIIDTDNAYDPSLSAIATCVDIIAVPIYGFILVELCRPGWIKTRWMVMTEVPFVVMSMLYVLTQNHLFYMLLWVLSLAYGLWCIVWMIHDLPRYHRWLKNEYSYQENINLHWLRGVTLLFFIILCIWVVDCIYPSTLIDTIYILSSLVGWMVVCYFINRQELVIKEVIDSLPTETAEPLAPAAADGETEESDNERIKAFSEQLEKLFTVDKVYLEPRLRLVDLAQKLGTNRTYLSNFFNKERQTTFYEFVNGYRISHSENLLTTTDYTLDVVAELSGFNSLSTFRRAFLVKNNCSPQEYRSVNTSNCQN